MSTAVMEKYLEEQPAPQFNVLVVDDEADVRSVTKLCLKNMKYKGIKVKVTEADSKAQAIELLKDNFGHPYVCAIVDVVMESDHAGLELVEYIRNDLGNKAMSIFLRTGQPGQAPEREVMENLELDGYVLKTELTDEKLYTLTLAAIKSTLRSWSNENAMGQLSLFSYGCYEKQQFMKQLDLAYALADKLAPPDKPTFAPGSYLECFGKSWKTGNGNAVTPELIAELLATAPVMERGPVSLHMYTHDETCGIVCALYSKQTGAMYVGHHIKWPEEWKMTWLVFFQLWDQFAMQTKVIQ